MYGSERWYLTGKEPLIARIIAYTNPHFKGRYVTLEQADTVYVNGEWTDGYRTVTSFFNVAGSCHQNMGIKRAAYGSREFGQSIPVTLPTNVVAVELHEGGRGPNRITIVANEQTIKHYKLNPEYSTSGLSWDERVVLMAANQWVSEARRERAMSTYHIPGERYDNALARLIQRGFMQRNKVLSVVGKNVADRVKESELGPMPDDFQRLVEDSFQKPVQSPEANATIQSDLYSVTVKFPERPTADVLRVMHREGYSWQSKTRSWVRRFRFNERPEEAVAKIKAALHIKEDHVPTTQGS
jgi:hypothetical protein